MRQADMTRAVTNATKIMVYRNLVKALPWYTSVREKIVVRLRKEEAGVKVSARAHSSNPLPGPPVQRLVPPL